MRKGKDRILNRFKRPSTAEEVIKAAQEGVHLDLSQWGLTELPKSLKRYYHFENIDLSINKLSGLPTFINKWTNVKTLTVSSNSLVELPVEIGQLSELIELKLRRNNLTKLPQTIGNLSQLKNLDLTENRLTELPDSIGDLSCLEVLDITNNQLSKLPESIGQISKLRTLKLYRNKITELPESLLDLKYLRELYLHENRALDLPEEILGPTHTEVLRNNAHPANPREILDYYFRIRKGKKPLNEAKLILVGRGGVGKTSIVNQLIYHRFDKDEERTQGININEWNISLAEGEEVRLNVWDFGGQEIMHATHQFFLTQRSLYLLVLSGREGGEDKDAEYWLKLIESFGNESPVIIVLNKIKKDPFDLNRRALLRKYPFIVREGFIKTDCEDATGRNELHQIILRETDKLKHLRDAFPLSWFDIKNKLAKMERNYLTFTEYREVCAQNGESDQKAQEELSTYLHTLGIILNYKDDPRLHDTHVLNPHWVTKGIYMILNSKILTQKKGEIFLTDLDTLLDKNEYPRSMHRFIFDLMKKFELCFSYSNDECRYLIPELLDKQEPEETATFASDECLNFQYNYPILPEGLLPRFIVRTHNLSEGLHRWRSGAILKFGESRALVKADAEDKKVFIYVKGKSVRQRCELLAIIRSDFDRIHSDIRNLQPQAMVPIPGYPDTAILYDNLIVLEQNKISEHTIVANGTIVKLSVQKLLNGVDLKSTYDMGELTGTRDNAMRLFYIYSHKDEELRDELENHLKILQREGLIVGWHDRKIGAGDEWKDKINENIESTDIILLIVSSDFIASDYCYENEMSRALERHNKNEARVIPVIVRAVSWNRAPFAKLQALPKDGLAVTSWSNKDEAWKSVSEGIESVIEQVKKSRSL